MKKNLFLLLSTLLLLTFSPLILCKNENSDIEKFYPNVSYLTTNYTIDFFRKEIPPQIRCHSNKDCPHYSSVKKKNIYGICVYNTYCTENKNKNKNKNKNGSNGSCVVIENNDSTTFTNDTLSYQTEYYKLEGYSQRVGFNKTSIKTVSHCNRDSIKSNYCTTSSVSSSNQFCLENSHCYSSNCQNNRCFNSNDFYIYNCKNGIDRITDTEIQTYTECKKIDHEYSDNASECVANYVVDGYCLPQSNDDSVHHKEGSDEYVNIVGIAVFVDQNDKAILL
ncbi:hypothetical protein PIROE2DRAFT_12387 [Piromyces sp. E2]|nr:hypothetical protein PIROE2DRAFT_12387 [Piromyces sp. E2]|eukprot:OUM61568.1 hypothetical protein PIROE2DRAFT_12387 [Piromyces sp. E2]